MRYWVDAGVNGPMQGTAAVRASAGSSEEIPKAEGSAGIEEALGAARFKNVGRLFSDPEDILDLALAILKPT